MTDAIKLFNDKKVRVQWDSDKEKGHFSIVDVVEVLTDSSIPKRFWSDLKAKLSIEGFEPYDKIVQLRLIAEDGRRSGNKMLPVEQMN
jgi:DNA-damage-inducible protein D